MYTYLLTYLNYLYICQGINNHNNNNKNTKNIYHLVMANKLLLDTILLEAQYCVGIPLLSRHKLRLTTH